MSSLVIWYIPRHTNWSDLMIAFTGHWQLCFKSQKVACATGYIIDHYIHIFIFIYLHQKLWCLTKLIIELPSMFVVVKMRRELSRRSRLYRLTHRWPAEGGQAAQGTEVQHKRGVENKFTRAEKGKGCGSLKMSNLTFLFETLCWMMRVQPKLNMSH